MNPVQPGAFEIGMFVLCCGVLFSIVVNVVKLRTMLAAKERQPPLDQELYREFVRKDDMAQLRDQFVTQVKSLDDRHQRSAGEIFSVMRGLQSSTERMFTDISKSIGRIEGKLEEHTAKEIRS